MCEGFSTWAGALDQTVIAHDPSPVQRIGAVVWLAKAALPAVGGAS
jgi:hypothetical protein